ncbi:MAG: helix-turn-helix domain-containing protein [Acidimicrobiales bacterium]
MEALLTVEEVAELLRVPVATIYRWRLHREGPPAVRVGRYLRYSSNGIQKWLDDVAANDPRKAA